MAESNTGESLLAFVLGAVAGAAVGVLFAPREGAETREALQEWLKESADKGTEYLKSKRESLSTQKEALAAALEAGKKAYRETGQG